MPDVQLARQLRRIARIAVIAFVPVVLFFTTEGTWNILRTEVGGGYSGRFFMAQAEAMSHGRLEVSAEDIHAECWYRKAETHCYGYFGVTPSLLRLPVLGVLKFFRSSMTPFYIAFAILLAYWTALRLIARGLLEFRPGDVSERALVWYFIVAAFTLGPGGNLLFLTRPAVFEEAVAWSVAFFLLTLDRIWVWHRSQRKSSLIWAVVFAVAAANARPTAVTGCFGLGVLVLVLWRLRADTPPSSARSAAPSSSSLSLGRGKVIVAAVCLSLLPLATSAGVFWLKFRTPFPDLHANEQVPEAENWAEILKINGDQTRGLMFLPTEMAAYFRPDGVMWRPEWPYADFPFPTKQTLWVPPLPAHGAYVERMTTVTATMPLSWVINVLLLGWLGMPRRLTAVTRHDWWLAMGLLGCAVAMIALTVTTVGITNRYLSDFFAISVVGFALGHRVVLSFLARHPSMRVLASVAAVAVTVWSVTITLLLTTRLVFD